jgi:DNA-binding PucR family transcriptional regulator
MKGFHSMLEKLKYLYGEGLIVGSRGKVQNPERYNWYTSEEGETFGVLSSLLNTNEESLLQLFLKPAEDEAYTLSEEQRYWKSLLFDRTIPDEESLLHSFRLIHFSLKHNDVERADFCEAVQGLFPSKVIILWESVDQGVFVEIVEENEDLSLPYEQIANALMSDFYMDLTLYIGSVCSNLHDAHKQFEIEKKLFNIAQHYMPKENVYQIQKVVPYLLFDQMSTTTKQFLTENVFKEVNNDSELIRTIKVYLECNMNLTLAAKKLYIHRNSLQYRVDKFIEKTGIDVKHFPQASVVYLGLLLRETI